MNNDTNPASGEVASTPTVGTAPCGPAAGPDSAAMPGPALKLPAVARWPEHPAVPDDVALVGGERLLRHLDELFRPLMQRSLIAPPAPVAHDDHGPSQLLTSTDAADETEDPLVQHMREQDEDRRELDKDIARHQAELQAEEGSVTSSQSPEMSAGKRKMPAIGRGPVVYVGFDAEWQKESKGHNLMQSLQWHLVGPTGETCSQVLDLDPEDGEPFRPRLADALDELLEEAWNQGVFDEWPSEVVMVGYFTRADLTVFSDFAQYRPQLDTIGGSLATVERSMTVELPERPQRDERIKSRRSFVVSDGLNLRMLMVRLVDASRLAPPATSLEKIGQWLGEPKIELPEGHSKSDMRRFKRCEPELFREYGIQDARLAVMYCLWVLWFCNRHLGIVNLPSTVSAVSVKLAELCMAKDGVHPDVALNFEMRERTYWHKQRERPMTQRERVPTPIRRWLEPFLADAYKGGRNECMYYGPTEVKRHFDPDLSACYLHALGLTMALDYRRVEISRDIEDYIGHVAGFAQVRFRFPAGTRYPCLPVQVGMRGLWFPLEGASLCTAPELELARAMGAEIEVEFGMIIPWKDRAAVMADSQAQLSRSRRVRGGTVGLPDGSVPATSVDGGEPGPAALKFPPDSHGDVGYRPFESFAICVRHHRLKYQRKTLPFEFMKLVGNGLYGKTGQGFKDKRQFSLKEMGSRPIGPSRVSEAAIAALVCGFVRAVVGELLWKLPADSYAVSVTTDGMLVDVPLQQMGVDGEMCRRFQGLVDRMAPGTPMLELKHQIMQCFAFRTRGQLTVQADGDHPIVVAKAGHQVPVPDDADPAVKAWLCSPEGQSDYMVRLALDRTAGQVLPRKSFFSLSEQSLNNWDLQTDFHEIKVNIEFDFKRCPVNARMVRMASYDAEHLAFDTVAWETVEQGDLVRTVFDQWRQDNCLKTLADWERWQAFLAQHVGNRRRRSKQVAANDAGGEDEGKRRRGATGVMQARGGEQGYLRIVVRTFLAAFTQGQWGLAGEKDVWTYKGLAEWLTGQGYAVSESDVKNARRTQLNERVAAATPPIRQFLDAMTEWFPKLEVERFVLTL